MTEKTKDILILNGFRPGMTRLMGQLLMAHVAEIEPPVIKPNPEPPFWSADYRNKRGRRK